MSDQTRELHIQNVSVSFGADRPAVNSASLTIPCGRVVSLLGPSGSGKSSLLRAVAGLEPITSGDITFSGHVWSDETTSLPPEKRSCGVVFQDFALFPHLDAQDNVGFGLKQLSGRNRKTRIQSALETVELAHKAKSYPHELSGGEQQRIALARALAPRPDIMLLDEPFSGLDRRLRTELRWTTIQALRQSGTAALVVTHDAEEAMTLADEIALMTDGEIIQTGAPDHVYLNPVSESAARLMGDIEVFEGQVTDGVISTPLGTLPAENLEPGQSAKVLIRPEGIVIGQAGPDSVSGRVIDRLVRTGYADLVIVLCDDLKVTARIGLSLNAKAGDEVHLRLEQDFVTVIAD